MAARCSRPAAIANAVADALGRDDIVLPLTRIACGRWRTARPVRERAATPERCQPRRCLTGEGEVMISAPVAEVWQRLIDPDELAAIVPGCRGLTQDGPDRYRAQVIIGVAGIRGSYDARSRCAISGKEHPFGSSAGIGRSGIRRRVRLRDARRDADGRTRLTYRYRSRCRRQGRRGRAACWAA